MENQKNQIMTKQNNLPAENPSYIQTQYNNSNNVNIGDNNKIAKEMTNYSINIQSPMINQVPEYYEVSDRFYNLFVIGDEDFFSNSFTVPKDAALTKHTEESLKNEYACLNEDAINKLKSYPCIFSDIIDLNEDNNNKYVFYGFITNIKVQDNGIKINTAIISKVKVELINKNTTNLQIKRHSANSELETTHWALKEANLTGILNLEIQK